MERKGRKINVLFVVIHLGGGGSERVVLDLTRNLNRKMFSVYVAFFFDGRLHKAFEEVCDGIFMIVKKKGIDLRAMLQLSRIIRDNQIDVVNAHHYMPFFYSYLGSKILSRRILIYTEHSVPEVEGIVSGKQKWLCNVMFYDTNSVIGVSREVADILKNRFPAHSEKIVSIPNGVDTERFKIDVDRKQTRANWGLLSEHFVIGNISNLRKVKNHVCLIRAFHRLSTVNRNLRLMLVGCGTPGDAENSEDEIKDLIYSLNLENKVVLTGYQEEIPQLLKIFDVFCLPSFSEGLPISILEAMAARVPVVGSNVRGIREVISHERTGLLFPSNDENALAKTLMRLISGYDFRARLCDNAYAFVSDNHGLKKWVLAYERLFLAA